MSTSTPLSENPIPVPIQYNKQRSLTHWANSTQQRFHFKLYTYNPKTYPRERKSEPNTLPQSEKPDIQPFSEKLPHAETYDQTYVQPKQSEEPLEVNQKAESQPVMKQEKEGKEIVAEDNKKEQKVEMVQPITSTPSGIKKKTMKSRLIQKTKPKEEDDDDDSSYRIQKPRNSKKTNKKRKNVKNNKKPSIIYDQGKSIPLSIQLTNPFTIIPPPSSSSAQSDLVNPLLH